jgi:hypothetical protein
MLTITDEVVCWWCCYTSTAEDQHCRRTYWPEGESDKDMILFNYQGDTEKAFLGVCERLVGHFHISFTHGPLDIELEDALLWCPIRSSERRIDPQT